MNRLTFKFAVALITCIVGVSAATAFFLRRQAPRTFEQPPCASCAQVYTSASSGLDTIQFSELAADPGRFGGRLVRVRANLENDAGYKSLYAPGPRLEGTRLMAEFNDPSSYAACGGVGEVLRDTAGIGSWFDGAAEVVVVGRLGALGNFRRGQFGFEIVCVERADTLRAHAR